MSGYFFWTTSNLLQAQLTSLIHTQTLNQVHLWSVFVSCEWIHIHLVPSGNLKQQLEALWAHTSTKALQFLLIIRFPYNGDLIKTSSISNPSFSGPFSNSNKNTTSVPKIINPLDVRKYSIFRVNVTFQARIPKHSEVKFYLLFYFPLCVCEFLHQGLNAGQCEDVALRSEKSSNAFLACLNVFYTLLNS